MLKPSLFAIRFTVKDFIKENLRLGSHSLFNSLTVFVIFSMLYVAFLKRVVVNGTTSDWQGVLSGIPQGLVLWPLLFVLYINSLPSTAQDSEIYLFADDTKVFMCILTEEDCDQLHRDLNRVYDWTTTSLLKFRPEKCWKL